MRTVRIYSDGTPVGTHIIDVATGEVLVGIQSVNIDIAVDQQTTALLTERVIVEDSAIAAAPSPSLDDLLESSDFPDEAAAGSPPQDYIDRENQIAVPRFSWDSEHELLGVPPHVCEPCPSCAICAARNPS